ncbi:hypothetical protein UlMin_025249 [Ulmus minor]
MATAPEEKQPYDGGEYGAGGKFRKRPFRRATHSTPYDRPPPVFRNPDGGNGGWLSKIVDPAHRIISYSAHRLFSSVFRKRLPAPQPLSPETKHEALNTKQEVAATDSPGLQGAVDLSAGPSNSANKGELTELEQILKQKTYTRSEIDRLTALLHSRTVDLSLEGQEKRSDLVSSKPAASSDRVEKPVAFPDRQEGFPKSASPDNGMVGQLVTTPVGSSRVLDGDVSSTTDVVELAKSYMHKRPVSPSKLGFRSQAPKENSTGLYPPNLISPSKLPVTPLVSRISGHAEVRENGFTTPRSRGRSAIYSMARTPYFRVHPGTSVKGAGTAVDAYGGASSSSQAGQEQNLLSGSNQVSLKRRNSVLDNDIGSFGPIRRIRQKPNLLSSRGLSSHVSGSPLSTSRTGLGSEAAENQSSSTLKPILFGGPTRNFIKPPTETRDKTVSNTSSSLVPSKSSEMASKILQQLDKLVSPKDKSSESEVLTLRDKSPTKLSPSMLHGQALKSLEDVDSSKYLENPQYNNMLDGSLDKMTPDSKSSSSQKQVKVKENAPMKLLAASDKTAALENGVDSTLPIVNGGDSIIQKKDPVLSVKIAAASNSAGYLHKKSAFQMSAHEDSIELDDDSYPNGAASDLVAEERGKANSLLAETKRRTTEAFTLEKPSNLTETNTSSSAIIQRTEIGASVGSFTAENGTNLTSQSASSPRMTVLHASSLTSDKEQKISAPIFNSGDKTASTEDTNAASTIFNFGPKSLEKVTSSHFAFASPPVLSEHMSAKFDASSDTKLETSSSLSTVAAGATDSVAKLSEPDKADHSNSNGVFSRTSETGIPSLASTSTSSIFSFSTSQANFGQSNESSASTLSTPVVFGNLNGQNSSSSSISATISSNISASCMTTASSTSAPSVLAAPVFKFGSSTPSTAAAPVSASSDVASNEPKTKQDTSFSGTSGSITGTGSSLFGFSASTANNQSQGSNFAGVSVSATSTQSPSAGNTVAAMLSPSVPFQFGSSAPSLTFGLSGNSTSGSSLFGSGATTGIGSSSSSSSSDSNIVSSSSGTTPSLFGSSWQSPKSSVSSLTSASSTGLSFGASVASSAPTSSSPAPSTGFSFGASAASSATPGSLLAPSTGFSFGASATASAPASSSPAPSTGFSFGASATSGVSTSSSLAPSTGFPFGASAASGATTNSSPATGFAFGASSASGATTSSSPAPSTFTFGSSSAAAVSTNSSPPVVFGVSNGASSSSIFSFNSSAATGSTQSVFGNRNTANVFGSSPGNNNQVSMEDSMAEDTFQASTPAVPVFGQQPIAPSPSPSGFAFGSTTPSVPNPFQFGGQANVSNPQNPSPFQANPQNPFQANPQNPFQANPQNPFQANPQNPFQASGSLGSIAEGSNFSMGSGGGSMDKSNRRYVKVKHKQRRK